MPLTPEEKKRYEYLMRKIEKFGVEALTVSEAKELKYLLQKREDLDEGLKLLLMFALGMLVGYALSKS